MVIFQRIYIGGNNMFHKKRLDNFVGAISRERESAHGQLSWDRVNGIIERAASFTLDIELTLDDLIEFWIAAQVETPADE